MKISVLLAPILFSMLFGCGGGGGGSGSSGAAARSVLEGDTRSSATGVRLLNGAVDSAPVDLISSLSDSPLTTTRFSLEAGFAAVATTPQVISVVPAGSASPRLFSQEIALVKNEHLTILLFGDIESIGLQTAVIPDRRVPDLAGGEAALRIIHATNKALNLDGLLNGVEVISNAPFGGASPYSRVAAGTQTVTARRSSDSFVLFSGSLQLDGGQNYSLFVTGEAGYLTVARLLKD